MKPRPFSWAASPTRTAFAGLAAAFLVGASVATPRAVAGTPDPPNVLFIVTDDHRASGTGFSEVMPVTYARFHQEGTRFPRAVATTPQCCPARSSIMTGRYAHNHGVEDNKQAGNLDHGSTLQAYLHASGYRTGVFGRFLNRWDVEQDPPHWDEWAVFTGGYYNGRFNINGTVRTVTKYSTQFIEDKAARFLRDNADAEQPWYLYVAPFAPHLPARPEPEYRGAPVPPWFGNPALEEVDRSDKPPYIQAEEDLDPDYRARRRQLRTLMSVDDMVERLFSTLTRAEKRNTLTVFVGDNGLMWGEHGWHAKDVPYTQSIRIPMYARWPDGGVGSGRDNRLVSNVDLAPTVLDAAGLEPDLVYPMDGRSLLDGSWSRDRILTEFWGSPKYPLVPEWGSTVTPTRQYVEYYDDNGAVTFQEWYDFEADPWQLENLLSDPEPLNDPPPEDVAAAAVQLQADRQCQGTEGPTACP